MYRIVHYKAETEAKLIQRMMIWQRFGCTMKEDSVILGETSGRPGALLYRHRKLVATGFFEATEYLHGLDEVKQDEIRKAVRAKPAPQPKPAPVERVAKPADPFSIEPMSGPNF